MSQTPPPPPTNDTDIQEWSPKQALHNRNVCCANAVFDNFKLFAPPRKSAETVQKQPQKNPNHGPTPNRTNGGAPFTLTPCDASNCAANRFQFRTSRHPCVAAACRAAAPIPAAIVLLPQRACCATVKQPGLHASCAGIVSLRRYCCA
jgi:hypothetical protein